MNMQNNTHCQKNMLESKTFYNIVFAIFTVYLLYYVVYVLASELLAGFLFYYILVYTRNFLLKNKVL